MAKLKAKDGEIVTLPAFDKDTPFTAKLRRPSLLKMCEAGVIPNSLVGIVRELFEGQLKGDITKYHTLLKIIAEQALVEPKYEDVKEVITDEQLGTIFDYVQSGVISAKSFRNEGNIQEIIDLLLQSKPKTVEAIKNK